MSNYHLRPSYGSIVRAAEAAMAAPFGMADLVWLTQINQALNGGDCEEHETPMHIPSDLRERLDLERAARSLYVNPETDEVQSGMRRKIADALGLRVVAEIPTNAGEWMELERVVYALYQDPKTDRVTDEIRERIRTALGL